MEVVICGTSLVVAHLVLFTVRGNEDQLEFGLTTYIILDVFFRADE